MLQRSIETAQESECFSHVLVSTDDNDIAELALKLGALVPFVRPVALANDHADTRSVIRHAIGFMASNYPQLDDDQLPVCCLYATAPFVDSISLKEALALLRGADFVVPVASFAYPVQRALKFSEEGHLRMFNPDQYATRSQDLDEAWHDVGQFYWANSASWLCDKNPFEMNTRAVKVPRWRAQDIDTPEDWDHAEILFKALQHVS